MIMHHETSGSVANYERHLDRAFDLMKKYDYPAVKTGYVGKIIRGEFHDGQTMVSHFNFVARRAANYKVMSEFAHSLHIQQVTVEPIPVCRCRSARGMSSTRGVLGTHLCMKPFYHLQDFWVARWIIHLILK
jgi:hypothetical protein